MGKYFTGKPCPKGHVADRYTSSKQCVVCAKIIRDALRCTPEGKLKHLSGVKLWQEANKEKVQTYKQRYADNNKDIILAKSKLRAKEFPEHVKEIKRKSAHKHKAKNLAHVRVRQTRKLQACPAWANLSKMKQIYAQARRLSDIIGIKYEVDHIVPLKNPLVCGLHIPVNLQIIPKWQNVAKSNKFEVS